MSDIPEARKLLLEAAKLCSDTATASRIKHIVRNYMTRQKPVRRAPEKPILIDYNMKQSIKRMAATNPQMHINEIAAQFKLNPGRVSEILNGKR